MHEYSCLSAAALSSAIFSLVPINLAKHCFKPYILWCPFRERQWDNKCNIRHKKIHFFNHFPVCFIKPALPVLQFPFWFIIFRSLSPSADKRHTLHPLNLLRPRGVLHQCLRNMMSVGCHWSNVHSQLCPSSLWFALDWLAAWAHGVVLPVTTWMNQTQYLDINNNLPHHKLFSNLMNNVVCNVVYPPDQSGQQVKL